MIYRIRTMTLRPAQATDEQWNALLKEVNALAGITRVVDHIYRTVEVP